MITTTIDPATTTLAAIVTTNPSAARILEGLGLDYCCGGRRTLADACAEAGVDTARALERLTFVADAPSEDWATMTFDELVDHIESTHHRYLHDELPRLVALAEKVRTAHGRRHPELEDVWAVMVAV